MTVTFDEAAQAVGLPQKLFYTVPEVAQVTGWSYSAILNEVKEGRLKAKRPEGARRGYKVRGEWVDEWSEADV